MKTKNKIYNFSRFALIAILLSTFLFNSCSKEDSDISNPDNASVIDDASRTIDDYDESDAERHFIWASVYRLHPKDSSGVRGFVVFKHTMQGTLVRIHVLNSTAGIPMPAHIHANALVEGGPVTITLNPLNGATGISTTLVTADDAGILLNFANLVRYNGHLNLHTGGANMKVVSCGDIGGNKLTHIKKVYPLFTNGSSLNIKGKVIFRKRINNNSLAIIHLHNTIPATMHPAHIHFNDVATGGPVIFTFNPINGNNGISMTNVKETNSGNPLKFQQILSFNGHINVHLNAVNTAIVAHGDIGNNF